MNETPLPDDLLHLENRLHRRSADDPPAELRDRVLHSVATELASRKRSWPGSVSTLIRNTGLRPVLVCWMGRNALFSSVLSTGRRPVLRRTCLKTQGRDRAGWHWIAAAASVLLVLNISMICASQNQFSTHPSTGANPIVSELQALQKIEAQQDRNFK